MSDYANRRRGRGGESRSPDFDALEAKRRHHTWRGAGKPLSRAEQIAAAVQEIRRREDRERVASLPVAPTPERLEKMLDGWSPTSDGAVVEKSFVDANRIRFTDEEVATALKLTEDALRAVAAPHIARYDGMPSARAGRPGNGPLSKGLEARDTLREIMREAHPGFVKLMAWFLCESARAKKALEMGRELTGFKDRATNKGVEIMAVKAMLWRVAEVYWKRGR